MGLSLVAAPVRHQMKGYRVAWGASFLRKNGAYCRFCVRKQIVGIDPFNQLTGLAAIRLLLSLMKQVMVLMFLITILLLLMFHLMLR